jgi:hypothetical protein
VNKLLLRIVDNYSPRTTRTCLQTFNGGVLQLLSQTQAVVEFERFGGKESSEFGLGKDCLTAGSVHAQNGIRLVA